MNAPLMNCLGQPDPLLMSREEANARGLTCHAVNGHRDYQWDRVRHGRPHPRLVSPVIVAQMESDLRDERYQWVEAA